LKNRKLNDENVAYITITYRLNNQKLSLSQISIESNIISICILILITALVYASEHNDYVSLYLC